jgi:hypothetical protein
LNFVCRLYEEEIFVKENVLFYLEEVNNEGQARHDDGQQRAVMINQREFARSMSRPKSDGEMSTMKGMKHFA